MKKDKVVRDWKLYNIIMSNIWQFIATILCGFLFGYLMERRAENKDINYMLFSVILFIVIGCINFFLGIIKQLKKIEKEQEKKQKEQVSQVIETSESVEETLGENKKNTSEESEKNDENN